MQKVRFAFCGLQILLVACSQTTTSTSDMFETPHFASYENGRQINYFSNSVSGPRIVLLASLGRPVSDFENLATKLGKHGYHVTAVDMRGVGQSDQFGNPSTITLYDLAKDVQLALKNEGLHTGEQVVVIGHAFGNRLARAFAHRYPDDVRGIILLAAGGAQNIQDNPKAWKSLMQSFDLKLPRESIWRPSAMHSLLETTLCHLHGRITGIPVRRN